MQNIIRQVAIKLGISGRLGWHTFRHTYSILLRAIGANIKVMQELLRHTSARMTLETYTQASNSYFDAAALCLGGTI